MKTYVLRQLFLILLIVFSLYASSFAADSQTVALRAAAQESFAAAEAAYRAGDQSRPRPMASL